MKNGIIKKGLIGISTALFVAVVGLVISIFGSSLTAKVASFIALAGLGMGILSLWYYKVVNQFQQEKEEQDELRAKHPDRYDIFKDGEEEILPGASAMKSFRRLTLPIFSIAGGVALIGFAVYFWSGLSELDIVRAEKPLVYASSTLLIMFAGLLCGSYFSGLSRQVQFRWFRPMGSWLILSAIGFGATAVTLLIEHFQKIGTDYDIKVAKGLLIVLIILGIELIFSVILDLYRPGKMTDERPLFDSKILSIIFQPGGVARNFSRALNYQFGFEVSDTWFYRFLEKALLPFVMVQLLLLYLFTGVVFVDSDEAGIRERFGRVTSTEPLGPGFHFKLPWPMAEIKTVTVKKTRTFEIGYSQAKTEENHKAGMARVNLWTKKPLRAKRNYIIPSKELKLTAGNTGAKTAARPIENIQLIHSIFSFHYKVTNLYDFLYQHNDVETLLKKMAEEAVTANLAVSDYHTLLHGEQAKVCHHILADVQTAADKLKIGVKITFSGPVSLAPPFETAESLEQIDVAREKARVKILAAKQQRVKQIHEASSRANGIVQAAIAATKGRVETAHAEAIYFKQQLPLYSVVPEIYLLELQLKLMTKTDHIRKYIVPKGMKMSTYDLNLEDQYRPSLLDGVDLSEEDESKDK